MILYKYYPSDLLIVLDNNMVRFTQPRYLNDSAFDCKPVLSSVFTASSIKNVIDDVFGSNMASYMNEHVVKYVNNATLNELIVVFRNLLLMMMNDTRSITSLGISLLDESIKKDLSALSKQEIVQKLLNHFMVLLSSRQDVSAYVRAGVEKNMTELEQMVRPKFESSMHSSIDETIGVFCLSGTATCPVMWGMYSDSGKGYVVGFDSSSPFFDRRKRQDDILRYLYQVVYTDERSSLDLSDYFLSDRSAEDNMKAFVEDVLLKKGSQWKHEEEWRIFQALSDSAKVIRDENGDIHLFEFPEEAVAEIIIGYNTTPNNERRIINIADYKYPNAILKKGIVSRESYKINIDPL